MLMVKAVIFDCFGVLYGGSLFTLLNMAPPERRQELVDLNKQNDRGYLEFDEYVSGVADIIGRSPYDVKELFAQKRVRNQPLFDYIKEIKSAEVKVGLLSNAGKDMPSALFNESELNGELFDAVVISSEVGYSKPSADIFNHMSEKIGVPNSDCIFIDDAFENCHGAEMTDMKAVWFADNASTKTHIEDFLKK